MGSKSSRQCRHIRSGAGSRSLSSRLWICPMRTGNGLPAAWKSSCRRTRSPWQNLDRGSAHFYVRLNNEFNMRPEVPMRKLLYVEDNEDNLYMLALRFDVL